MSGEPRTRWLGPATEAAVAEMEARLSLRFPSQYRAFLLRCGCGLVGHTEIYGLGCPPGRLPDLAFVLDRLEARGFVRPGGLVPISALGNGDLVALVAEPLGEHAVGALVYWQPSRDHTPRIWPAAADFDAWLAAQGGAGPAP